MQELINRIVSQVGVDSNVAEKVIGIVLNLFKDNAPSDKFGALLQGMPGAQELLDKFSGEDTASESSGGLLSGALGSLTGSGELMETLSKLQGAGLDMTQAQTAGSEIIAFAKEKVGEETVKEVAKSIPGLSQLL